MVAKKIMIAGGCSYTDQDYKTSNKDRDQTPGLWPMWPEHLGKKLDLEVVNTAKCGAGNEEIIHRTMENILIYGDRVDTVVVLFSEFDRLRWHGITNIAMMAEVLISEGHNPAFQSNKSMDWRAAMGLGDLAYNFFTSKQFPTLRYTYIKYCLEDNMRRIMMLAEYCKAKNIKFICGQGCTHFQFQFLNRLSEAGFFNAKSHTQHAEYVKLWTQNPWFGKLESEWKDNIIGWPFESLLSGYTFDALRYMGKKPFHWRDDKWNVDEIDLHPNAEAQIIFGDMFYERYQKVYG